MTATPEHSPEALSLARITPREAGAGFELRSRAIGVDGALALQHSAMGGNRSPPLAWTPVANAGAYALILEDPDAPREKPFVHWLIWNIPGEAASLEEGLPNMEALISPQGALQGRNDNGSWGYFGPRPPLGSGPHHYHFQFFALDGPLTLRPEHSDLRALVGALQGRVIAETELVGIFEAPAA
jgi:Raf kinase inhibitor-like YbhB/YbcL family protein